MKLAPARALDDILDDIEFCEEWCAEEGEPEPKHADPENYTVECVNKWYGYALCPLHIDLDYPTAPFGLWRMQVAEAGNVLAEITERHTGRPVDREKKKIKLVAIAAEVDDVFDRYPHARHQYQRWQVEGTVTIEER